MYVLSLYQVRVLIMKSLNNLCMVFWKLIIYKVIIINLHEHFSQNDVFFFIIR